MTRIEDIEEAATLEAFNLCCNFLTTRGYTEAADALVDFLNNGTPHSSVATAAPVPPVTADNARELGFTGNTCATCGSMQMVRNGACEKCTACGSSTGCS